MACWAAWRWAMGKVQGSLYWGIRIMLRIIVGATPEFVKVWLGGRMVVVSVCLVRTTSPGRVWYDPGSGTARAAQAYLETREELGDLWEAWASATAAMAGATEITPWAAIRGPQSLLGYARFMGTTYYHYHGTLSALVGEGGELEGAGNVVVADASALECGVEAGTARATAEHGWKVGRMRGRGGGGGKKAKAS